MVSVTVIAAILNSAVILGSVLFVPSLRSIRMEGPAALTVGARAP